MSGMRGSCIAWDDVQLVRLAQRGDGRAFQALFQKHRRRVTHHVERLVRSRSDADDLVQEAFIRAWRGLRAFRGQSTFYSWLYRIATSVALAFLRRAARRRHEVEAQALQEGADPEQILIARQTGQAAERALAVLPPEQARALALYEEEGKSYREIARTLGVPIGTVRTHIFRARRALAAALERPAPDAASWGAPRCR
jgi:RNA polymerase sigma-70 factor (ECF subfamily)